MTQRVFLSVVHENSRSCFKNVLIATEAVQIHILLVHASGTYLRGKWPRSLSLQILIPARGKSSHRKRMRNRELPIVNDYRISFRYKYSKVYTTHLFFPLR